MKSPNLNPSIEWWTPSINVEKRDVKWVVESVLVHVAALALIFLLDRFFPQAILVSEEAATIEIQVPTYVERTPAPIQESHGSQDGGKPAPSVTSKAAAQSARANSIATGLSKIANSMSFSKVGDMAAGQAKVRSGENVQTSQVLTGLTKMLGKNRSTDLSQSLTKVGSGSFAKGIRWDMFAADDKGFSKDDERAVSNAFKGIDGEMRDCYEAGLLRDDALSGVMKMQLQIVSGRFVSPHYEFEGSATPDGEATLKGCLTKLLQKFRVKSSITGKTVKLERVFK